MAAQDKAKKNNYVKIKIDKTPQNSKCRLCGDIDETINHIISQGSKLAKKKFKTRHDTLGKGIPWELCKKSNFDHKNKWLIHNLESVVENQTHKILWDFQV